MKILLVNDNPFEFHKGSYYTSYTWPLFAKNIADFNHTTSLLSPVIDVADKKLVNGELFDNGRLKIISNFYYTGYLNYYQNYYQNYFKINRAIHRLVKSYDIILIRIPSPIIPLIAKHTVSLKKPFVLLAVGNLIKSANSYNLTKNYIVKILLKSIFKITQHHEYGYLKKTKLLYAHGQEIAKYYRKSVKNIKLMRTAHLSLNDINYVSRSKLHSPVRLLSMGWLGPVKGHVFLIRSMKLLINRGYNVILKLYGKEIDCNYSEYLKNLVFKLDLLDYVKFMGPVYYHQVSKIYQESDIQIISSTSEGIPRVILEGAANSLPLVCTSVGGCLSAVQNGENGILVAARDPAAMANGIEHVIRNDHLRRNIIQGGLEMAKCYSAESICPQIVMELNEIVKKSLS